METFCWGLQDKATSFKIKQLPSKPFFSYGDDKPYDGPPFTWCTGIQFDYDAEYKECLWYSFKIFNADTT